MPSIIQLSTLVANLIAAGEVVERPASVVKELLENSIDAGARHITVEIQNGGMTLLRVQDDGCGIAPEDAETAFLRHATSKLRRKEDLEAIGTLGFRGEALAATAAVSRIDLLTRTPDRSEGIRLHLEAGKVREREAVGCPVGTTILVRDLFYNTPARMKFMKTDKAEASAVLAAVQKQALAHPECAIRMLSDGEEKLAAPGDGALRSAIYTVLGRQTALDMLPVESSWEKVTVSGFVSKPTAARGSRSYEIFFVNGRYVKSKLLQSALEEAYRNQMTAGRFPACVLNLTLPLGAVDVNVHPAKTEVKFLNEREVFDCVHYGVLAALNRQNGRVEMDLGNRQQAADSRSAAPICHPERSEAESKDHAPAGAIHDSPAAAFSSAPKKDAFRTMNVTDYRAFLSLMDQPRPKPSEIVTQQIFSPTVLHSDVQLPSDAPAGAISESPVSAASEPEQTALPLRTLPYRVVGEVLNTYLIVEQADSVLFIDKHAAHERINFERLLSQGVQVTGQLLLAPMTVELDPTDAQALEAERALLQSLGYDFDAVGGGTLLLRQIPADLDESDAAASLSEIAAHLQKGVRDSAESLRETLLHTIACKSAIKGGWTTSETERDHLVQQVLSRDDLKYCPHGRPIVVTLTKKQLEKQFKRQ